MPDGVPVGADGNPGYCQPGGDAEATWSLVGADREAGLVCLNAPLRREERPRAGGGRALRRGGR